MVKTPVVLAVGLVVVAVAIVWLRPSEPEADSAPTLAADWAASEDAPLADRVADLEAQVSALTFAIDGLTEALAREAERTDSLDAESAAAIRDMQQRLAAASRPGLAGPGPGRGPGPGQGPSPDVTLQGPPGSPFEGQSFVISSNGQTMRFVGADGQPITADTVAAAAATGNPMMAPPTLQGVQANTGQTLVFKVTGSNEGTVWGTDVYTDDSSIGAAAVHAGILRPGETGTIMVTVQNGYQSYAPSSRNGIDSASYGEWGRSFTMIRLN
jgi:hypothetical protein